MRARRIRVQCNRTLQLGLRARHPSGCEQHPPECDVSFRKRIIERDGFHRRALRAREPFAASRIAVADLQIQLRKAGIRRSELRIGVDRVLEILDPLLVSNGGPHQRDIHSTQVQFIRRNVWSVAIGRWRVSARPRIELGRDTLRYLVLKGEDIAHLAVVDFRPACRPVTRVYQADLHAKSRPGLLHASLQDRRYPETLGDFARIPACSPQCSDGSTRDDPKIRVCG